VKINYFQFYTSHCLKFIYRRDKPINKQCYDILLKYKLFTSLYSLHHSVWYFVWSMKSVGKKFLSKNKMSSEMLDVNFGS